MYRRIFLTLIIVLFTNTIQAREANQIQSIQHENNTYPAFKPEWKKNERGFWKKIPSLLMPGQQCVFKDNKKESRAVGVFYINREFEFFGAWNYASSRILALSDYKRYMEVCGLPPEFEDWQQKP